MWRQGRVAVSRDVWVKVLKRHFGDPIGSVETSWHGFLVLTEAGYTTADCDDCGTTVAGDADPAVVAQVLDGHHCLPA